VSSPNAQTPPQWTQDQVDLTPYARKKILVRFEYITDDAYNRPSWALDDITIPEINFSDNVENGNNGWDAKGFVRSNNILPQHFAVQLVEKGTTTSVVSVPLDDRNQGSISIAGFGTSVTGAELIITSGAPTTTEPTQYEFSIVPK
jgi:hypothetical protein